MNAGEVTQQAPARAGQILVAVVGSTIVLDGQLAAIRVPCLLCEQPIGTRPHDQVVIWPASDAGCPCGQLGAAVYAVHKDCDATDISLILELAQVQSITCMRHQGRRLW